jgi:hypothetical protein
MIHAVCQSEMNPQYGIPEQKNAARTDDPHGRLYRSSPFRR